MSRTAPNLPPPAEDTLRVWQALNTRTACVLQVGGFRPTGDAAASHIGLAPLMRADEDWPLDLAGQPMQAIAQLNLLHAPWRPEALSGLALLTFFVGERFIESGCAPGTWALRPYASLDALAPRAQPAFRDTPWVGHGFEARWQPPQDDHPVYDDPDMRLPPGLHEFPEEAHGQCLSGTKLGGYPTNLQHSVTFLDLVETEDGTWGISPDEPDYVLQIDSEGKAGLNWVDGGIVYLGRHPRSGLWSAHCQFY